MTVKSSEAKKRKVTEENRTFTLMRHGNWKGVNILWLAYPSRANPMMSLRNWY